MRQPIIAALAVLMAVAAHGQTPDTVRVGSPWLDGARLNPGHYTVDNTRRAGGMDTRVSQTIRHVGFHPDMPEAYLIETTHISTPGDTTRSWVTVRQSDFALLHQKVKAPRDSAAVTTGPGHLTGWVVLPDTPIQLIDHRLLRPVFPVEGQIPWLFPLLPLGTGFEATLEYYSPWSDSPQWKTVRVAGVRSVVVGETRFDCWEIDGGELFPGYRVTYWVDRETRRVVKGVAMGPPDGPQYHSEIRVSGN